MKILTVSSIFLFLLCNFLFSEKREAVIHSANTVIEVLDGDKFVRHLTPQMIDIARNGHLLPEDTKIQLKSYGFDFSEKLVVLSRPNLPFYYDSQYFRLHYALDGLNAVDNTDSDGDGIPNYIETMANVFEEVYSYDINVLGYIPPPNDDNNGGSDAFDVYVVHTNYYGLTYWDDYVGDNLNSIETEVNAYSSYMWMRNNYDGFQFSRNTELENIQVTAAHEFFHAIQFGYDAEEEFWLMEATATYIEEANYDDVNDCYQYLIPRFEKPHLKLNSPDGSISTKDYGSFILFKYIDEHLGGADVIRSVWEQSRYFDGLEGDFSIQVIDNALRDYGHSFKLAFNNMAIANVIMSSDLRAKQFAYEEAGGYKNYLEYAQFDTVAIELAIHDSLDFIQGIPQSIESYNMQEYASQYVKVNTDTPMRISLIKPSGDNDALYDLKLHTVRKTLSGNFEIQSGYMQNIDPSDNTDCLYAVIVADDANSTDYNYILNFSDGIADSNTDFILLNQFPNPFNSSINIKLRVITHQNVEIVIHDMLGRKVVELQKGYLSEGSHDFTWNGNQNDGTKASSGVYYVIAKGASRQEWTKITLIK